MLGLMQQLRLVTSDPASSRMAAKQPKVSLRLLMAASGRCSCDDCLLAYRRGDKRAGVVAVRNRAVPLTAVR
jgi:hypothetical protein